AFDFHRRDVLAAAADRVLDAVDEVEVAVFVAAAGITAVQPQVAPHPGGGLGLVPVAEYGYPGFDRTDQDFAQHVRSNRAIVLVGDHDLELVGALPADDLVVGYRRSERHKDRSVHFRRSVRG